MTKTKKIQTKMKTRKKTSTFNYPLSELIFDLPSDQYHSILETYSSSQLKTIVDNEEMFFKKYVEKSIPREESEAFDVGSYLHTLVLEPHRLNEQCAVFPGKIRRGEAWERFKKKHVGKAIVTPRQRQQAEDLCKAVRNSPIAMGYLNGGHSEVSIFVRVAIERGMIFALDHGLVLSRNGWIKSEIKPSSRAIVIVLKARADRICLDGKWILDIKSTTGNAKNDTSMQMKIKGFDYHLSAALYLDLFSIAAGHQLDTFLWTFASKDCLNSKTYKASKECIEVGRSRYVKGLLKLSDNILSDWKFPDSLGTLGPYPEEMEHLKIWGDKSSSIVEERDIDLI